MKRPQIFLVDKKALNIGGCEWTLKDCEKNDYKIIVVFLYQNKVYFEILKALRVPPLGYIFIHQNIIFHQSVPLSIVHKKYPTEWYVSAMNINKT